MSVKTFKIDHHKIVLGYALHKVWGSEIKVRGALDCYGEGHRFIAYFLAEDSPVPKTRGPGAGGGLAAGLGSATPRDAEARLCLAETRLSRYLILKERRSPSLP